jgi:hypothetical protein
VKRGCSGLSVRETSSAELNVLRACTVSGRIEPAEGLTNVRSLREAAIYTVVGVRRVRAIAVF